MSRSVSRYENSLLMALTGSSRDMQPVPCRKNCRSDRATDSTGYSGMGYFHVRRERDEMDRGQTARISRLSATLSPTVPEIR